MAITQIHGLILEFYIKNLSRKMKQYLFTQNIYK